VCLAVAAACGKSPISPAPVSTPTNGTQGVPVTTPLAFASNRDGRSGIYVLDGEGAAPRRLADGTDPDWSVDDRIAFGWLGKIYVIPALGGGQQYVGPGEYPSWSPDGRFLAVTRNDDPYVDNILSILDVDGGGPRRDIYPLIWSHPDRKGWVWAQHAVGPAWSPDGRSIAFSGCSSVGHPWDWGSTCGRLWDVTIEGDQIETELTDRGTASAPSWSSDGRLAFEWDNQIYVRSESRAGGAVAYGISPDWTPDGRLVFAAQVPGATGFRLVVLENGTPRQILPDDPMGKPGYSDSQIAIRPR